jgi:transposase
MARLERENAELRTEVERLRRALEEALRASKRQAAPFSRQKPKAHPQKPGRKSGQKYGRRYRRTVPERIDEVVEVPLPAQCPRCGGGIEEGGTVSQFQTEIPSPQVERIEFRIHVGRCRRCRRRVQGRHPRQTSNAIGSAASQLGPRALALVTLLNKGLGLPYGKTATVLEQAFGLRVSRGGLCQAMERVADKVEPTYQALVAQVRGSPSVTPDETGWRVEGQLWWMWAFSTAQVTVYAIQPGRGFAQAAAILGADFAGFLVRDGWGVYRQFSQAVHQSCLAHLLRRCRETILVAGKGAAKFPRTVQVILQAALELRDRRAQGRIGDRGVAVAQGRLEARLDRSLQRRYRSPRNQRLANHLLRERDALFTFLNCPGLEATNWRAEQAIRPMVVARKVWGGNRTARGAQTQSILASFLQTCRQQLQPASSVLQTLLCSPQPQVLDLIAPTR